ncbi:MAG: fumarate/nitrate reduction transcriptional regulator Fnr [Pseudomonadales bacterium]|jgi:CRP/FNR family transcriptional regulator|nr:fumarate/nitrate reduction transcriptional regulator Fnr [Pseudomonadales bacterium]
MSDLSSHAQDTHTFQPHCHTCSLSNICLPISVADQELTRLDEIIERGRPLRRNDHVFRAEDPFSSVFAVRSGAIKTYRLTEEGEEQIMGFHLPGEIFGMGGISTGRHPNSAIALETCAVCEIPFDRIEPLSRDIPSLQRHLFQLLSREITEDQQLMLLLSKKTAEERIASLLLSLSSRLRRRRLSGEVFRLPMSRGDIGNYLGLVVETVSRVFTRMQRQGVLEVDGKEVRILDADQLAEMAGTRWIESA